jgi:hypothetical protein
MYHALPRTERNFLVFEGLFSNHFTLLLYTATYGIDTEDASFFILERVTDLPPFQNSIQPERSRNGQAS